MFLCRADQHQLEKNFHSTELGSRLQQDCCGAGALPMRRNTKIRPISPEQGSKIQQSAAPDQLEKSFHSTELGSRLQQDCCGAGALPMRRNKKTFAQSVLRREQNAARVLRGQTCALPVCRQAFQVRTSRAVFGRLYNVALEQL